MLQSLATMLHFAGKLNKKDKKKIQLIGMIFTDQKE